MIKKTPYGKKIEYNLINSLKMAGINIKTSAELDHNHKIDFILKLKNQTFGVQFSLKRDDIKARVAKICALERVSRFIYLSLAGEFFGRPDKQNGKDLYSVLNLIAENYSYKAMWVNIDRNGLRVQAL